MNNNKHVARMQRSGIREIYSKEKTSLPHSAALHDGLQLSQLFIRIKNKFFYVTLLSIFIFFSSLNSAYAASKDIYPFANQQQSQRFTQLTEQLRCLVCQNQTLADSDAGLAKDLRQEIYSKIQAGQSDQQIRSYLVARYGEFVLYKPPLQSNTWLLWFAPFLALLIGFIVLLYFLKAKRSHKAAPITTAQKAQLKSLLQQHSLNDKDV